MVLCVIKVLCSRLCLFLLLISVIGVLCSDCSVGRESMFLLFCCDGVSGVCMLVCDNVCVVFWFMLIVG